MMRERFVTGLSVLSLVAGAFGAALAAILRRLRHGPLVPSWDWSLEITVAALRASVTRALGTLGGEAGRVGAAAPAPPVPRALRGVLELEQGQVGGIPGEWIRRSGGLVDRLTVLYFHGGGYVFGTPATQRALTSALTWSLHARTFVPDYRLGPRHLFPAAVDDALASYRGLLAEGFDPGRIVLAGDSAGGGLAAGLMIRLRDEGHPLPGAALLFSPYADLEHTGATLTLNAATDYLSIVPHRPNRAYLGDADPRHPWASPIHGDFTGCPPMLVFAGGREVLLDDSRRLAEAAARDGVDVTLEVEPDMIHVWPAVVARHPASVRALARSAEWLATVVGG